MYQSPKGPMPQSQPANPMQPFQYQPMSGLPPMQLNMPQMSPPSLMWQHMLRNMGPFNQPPAYQRGPMYQPPTPLPGRKAGSPLSQIAEPTAGGPGPISQLVGNVD